MLAGAFMLFVVWLASQWNIASYENRRLLIANTCDAVKKSGQCFSLCFGWRSRTVWSKVWMVLSLALCVNFGVAAGMYLAVVVEDLAVAFGGEARYDLFVLLSVALGIWASFIRVCSLSIGLGDWARLVVIPSVGALDLVVLGALLKPLVVSHELVLSVIEFGVPASTMFNLIWFVLMGAYLMIHECESMRVRGQLSSSGKSRLMAVSDWVRRDIPAWLVLGALATFALIVLECIGMLLMAFLLVFVM